MATEEVSPKLKGDVTEDQLEEDFLNCVSRAKMCIQKLPAMKRNDAEKWLLYLMSRTRVSKKEKMLRNMHLLDILGDMMLGNLTGIYACKPPNRNQPLPPLPDLEPVPTYHEGVPSWVKGYLQSGEEVKTAQSKKGAIRHRSKDGRTYLATKELPNGRGAMGFVALSMDEQEVGEGDRDIYKKMVKSQEKGKIWNQDGTRWYKKMEAQQDTSVEYNPREFTPQNYR